MKKLLLVNNIIKCYIEQGITQPLLCILSNGKTAVVKYPNNYEGTIVLINEYLSYRIASSIGISVPEGDMCMLDDKAKYDAEFQAQQNANNIITTNNYGLCFYSSYISNTIPVTPASINRLKNKDELQKMIIFDHIIYNKDRRHNGNMLLKVDEMKFYAIDHSHVFKNECIWDRCTFEQGINDKDYNDFDIINANKETYNIIWQVKKFNIEEATKEIEEIQRILTPDFIHAIINELPPSWCSAVSNSDIEALEKYLNFRILHLPDIIKMLSRQKEGVLL